jgi:glycosyltransferase involved in cell wall biosynthesis
MIEKNEQEIMQNWSPNKQPVVSICCAAFNHEKYIGAAIEGFLMQEADFPFEVIVRDDCSTDKTATIIKRYAEKYPNIIKPIFEAENQYSKGIGAMSVMFKKGRGEYLALCEGDDYWLDPLKLQKQVDFLNENKNFSMCATRFVKSISKEKIETTAGEYDLKDLLVSNRFGTATVMFRQKYITDEVFKFIKGKPVGDWSLWVMLLKKGKAIILSDVTAVYRIHDGGVYSSVGEFKKLLITFNCLSMYYKEDVFSDEEKRIIFQSARKKVGHMLNYNLENGKSQKKKLIKEYSQYFSSSERLFLQTILMINYYLFRKISWRIMKREL